MSIRRRSRQAHTAAGNTGYLSPSDYHRCLLRPWLAGHGPRPAAVTQSWNRAYPRAGHLNLAAVTQSRNCRYPPAQVI